uniref:Thioredoxin domain-containing protein n=1 Tax=Micromonas pusilla TaxID=38833 RepID=A0A7S0NJA0_MICPS|mmetsp:Transcript_187/g.804  ORF Transcript_187/g.804 Transcript_187/m.804 type:complete len:160 (+) Transcript_187:141-620(+)
MAATRLSLDTPSFAPSRVARPSGRRAMRCNAAAKGIQGDGKVQLCISKEQFDAINDKAGDSLVAVQISTKTCGPCKVVYPYFAGLSEELPDVSFVKIMGDHDADTRALMKEWGVRVVPLFMLFRNGEKVTEWSGAKPEVLRDNVIEACNDKEKATMVTV